MALIRAQPAEAEDAELEDVLEEDEGEEDAYAEVINLNNRAPDFDDPQWAEKVTDWSEFWFNPEWEDDILELEDEHDAATISDMRLQRAEKLVEALSDMQTRDDVIKYFGPVFDNRLNSEDPTLYEFHEEHYDPNPSLSPFDFRAIVEKRRKKGMLDEEWRRRQALVGRFNGRNNDHLDEDVRLQGQPLTVTWSHEDMMKLITGDGAYVHPDEVQVSSRASTVVG